MSISPDFSALSVSLEEESTLRERLRETNRSLESQIRRLLSVLNTIHGVPSLQFPDVLQQAKALMPAIGTTISTLNDLIPKGMYWRYSDIWSRNLQSASFAVCLMFYLEKEELLSKSNAEIALGVKPEWQEQFRLTTEDYLHGLVTLVNELARLCPNATVNKDFTLPIKISKFCKEVAAGFALLNLKNDSLRKRFDGMKYDIKRMEEVCFDLTLRGLVTPDVIETGNKRPRTEEVEMKSEEVKVDTTQVQ